MAGAQVAWCRAMGPAVERLRAGLMAPTESAIGCEPGNAVTTSEIED